MSTVLAAAPILVVLVLLGARVPSLWAAGAGLVTAGVAAAVGFPISAAAADAALEGTVPTVAEVALILLGGVTLAEAMTRSGAQDRIAAWLTAVERRAGRPLTVLLLVYGLTPFMESVTGFGLGVVITAPLLIRIGVTPVRAVVAGLLGLVLVPWGSLAPGTLVAAELGGVGFVELGVWTALLSLPVLLVSGIAAVSITLGRPTARQLTLVAGVLGLEWAALAGASLLIGPPLAGVIASATVIAALLLMARARTGALPPLSRPLLRAIAPYGLLVAGILVGSALTAGVSGLDLSLLANPALWLLISAAAAVRSLPDGRGDAALASARRWLPIAGNAVAFMVIGFIMAATGMAEHLALFAAQAGLGFIAAIPVVGALGGFLTGSNTGSAAMFSTANTAAAASLGANPLVALAGQNAAGSFAIIASPPRIALAVGVALAPGERLPSRWSRILWIAVVAAAVLIGAATFVLA